MTKRQLALIIRVNKFDNEVLIDFLLKSCEKSCMENSI